MKIIVDFSDYQAGLDIDAVAGAVDGCWAKAGDWSWIVGHGWPGDYVHTPAVNRCIELGKPVGSYFFVRPGWTDPATQIDQWRAHVPAGTTVVPMIDLEVPGTLSGGSLTDWIAEALALTADRFEIDRPVLYWSAAFQADNGMGTPDVPHHPQCAEYHEGYQTFYWADQAWWAATAYAVFGGPDVPNGYPGLTKLDMIWQFTSSAQIPGFVGLVDCSFVNDAIYAQLLGAGAGPRKEFTVAEYEAIMAAVNTAIAHAASASQTAQENQGLLKALTDAAQLIRADAAAASETAQENQGLLRGDPARGPSAVMNLAGTVDAQHSEVMGRLAAIVGGSGADPAMFAQAILDALARAFGQATPPTSTPAQTFGLAASATTINVPATVPLADPNPDKRTALALAEFTESVFDPNHGVAAQTALRTAKLRGDPVTAEEHNDALKRALADTAARAGLHAQGPPPPPPPPPPPAPADTTTTEAA